LTVSHAIDAALEAHGVPNQDYVRAAEHPCEGAKFHSPRPLVTRLNRWLAARQDEIAVFLCPTCEANLAVLLHLLRASDSPPLDWTVLREFGNQLRALGQRIEATVSTDV
jgi:hypothetical protein